MKHSMRCKRVYREKTKKRVVYGSTEIINATEFIQDELQNSYQGV